MKPDSFQILFCGIDGKFGKENVYKSALVANADVPNASPNLSEDVIGTDTTNPDKFPAGNFDHLDDQTNFSTGAIGDDLP